MPINAQDINAVILAGGQGSRLGGLDKGLIELNKRPLIQHVIERIQQQVSNIIISANRNISDYANFGFEVYEDDIPDFAGPLAGILRALEHCQNEWIFHHENITRKERTC